MISAAKKLKLMSPLWSPNPSVAMALVLSLGGGSPAPRWECVEAPLSLGHPGSHRTGSDPEEQLTSPLWAGFSHGSLHSGCAEMCTTWSPLPLTYHLLPWCQMKHSIHSFPSLPALHHLFLEHFTVAVTTSYLFRRIEQIHIEMWVIDLSFYLKASLRRCRYVLRALFLCFMFLHFFCVFFFRFCTPASNSWNGRMILYTILAYFVT